MGMHLNHIKIPILFHDIYYLDYFVFRVENQLFSSDHNDTTSPNFEFFYTWLLMPNWKLLTEKCCMLEFTVLHCVYVTKGSDFV